MIFVRTSEAEPARGVAPRDLAVDGGTTPVSADTPVALGEGGPFEPLASAVERDPRVRDLLARDLPVRGLRGHAKVRIAVALLAVVPAVLLVAVDALAVHRGAGSPRLLIVDLILGAYVAFELTRPTPRMPSAAALALFAIALRWALFVTRLCGQLPAYVYLAPIAATLAALLVLVRIPPASRVALELLDRLGITRTQAREATRVEPPSNRLVALAVVAAVGVPASLHLLRSGGAAFTTQAAVFVAYALFVPALAVRVGQPGAPLFALPRGLGARRILWGVAVGLVVTAAVMTGARSFFDTGTELARCVDRLDAEARMLAAREASELSNAVVRVRASAPLLLLTALVFPLAEERVYRGLLQDTLVRKYGSAYGLFASAVVFGAAHVGVYQIGLYQTVLLGIAFGVTYLEGGIVASFVVHATWNLLLLL